MRFRAPTLHFAPACSGGGRSRGVRPPVRPRVGAHVGTGLACGSAGGGRGGRFVPLFQGAQGENRLATVVAPAHPGAFEPLRDEGFARGFCNSGTDREMSARKASVAHAVAMVADAVDRADHLATLAMVVGQVAQVPDDLLHALGVVAQNMTIFLEFDCEPDGAFAVNGDHDLGKVLRRA